MNRFLRIFIGLSVISLTLLVTATSCNKTDGNNANNSANNSGGGSSGDGSRCSTDPTKCLTLGIQTADTDFKIVDKTNVVVNVAQILNNPKGGSALSSPNNADRSFDEARRVGNVNGGIPYIYYYTDAEKKVNGFKPSAAFTFVTGKDVNTNTLAVGAAKSSCKNGGENEDNVFATRPQGGICKDSGSKFMYFYSYLGTVFNNTDTTKARGLMRCDFVLKYSVINAVALTADTVPNSQAEATCGIAVVNSGNPTTANIDDNWIDGDGGTATEEVELYAISILLGGKKISEIATDLGFTVTAGAAAGTAGNGLFEFNKAWDNAAVKKLLEKYEWRDLRFKVKLVKAADFAKL